MADGVLVDYALWRPGWPDGVGDVHRGRVTALVPAMAGAFVALDGAEGFLPDSEGAAGLAEGAILTVRIVRAALGGKGPRLSARVERAEDGPVGRRRRGADPLRELAARYSGSPVFVDDPALAASLLADLGDRIRRVPDAFDDAIETEVESLAAPDVVLASGARLSFWPTPALVAIDVDAGGALVRHAGGARGGPAEGGLAGQSGGAQGDRVQAGGAKSGGNTSDRAGRRHRALNAALLPELARQIRLRNLSGAILVDLAGMKARQRASLGDALMAALADDPLRPRFLGFTALGLAEIARPRVRAPLHEALSGPLASGLAALRAIARACRADPGQRVRLHAAPAVAAALEADPVALADLARIAGQGLNLRSDPSLNADGWHIEAVHG